MSPERATQVFNYRKNCAALSGLIALTLPFPGLARRALLFRAFSAEFALA
jgi:hypothetical protein